MPKVLIKASAAAQRIGVSLVNPCIARSLPLYHLLASGLKGSSQIYSHVLLTASIGDGIKHFYYYLSLPHSLPMLILRSIVFSRTA